MTAALLTIAALALLNAARLAWAKHAFQTVRFTAPVVRRPARASRILVSF